MARVLKSSLPCVLIVTWVPLGTLARPFVPCSYSILTVLSASEPTRVTTYGVVRQPAGVAGVSLLGGVCASADAGRPNNAMIAPSSGSDDLRRAMVSRYSACAGVICSVARGMTSVQVTTWFLQMTDPAQLAEAPEPDPDLEIRQAELPSPELSRMLYTGVGSDWSWTDRRGWTWERWREWLARPELETWVAYVRGTPAGFAELEDQGDAVELVSFGLLPAFIGPRARPAAARRGAAARLGDRAAARLGAHLLARRAGGAAHLPAARAGDLRRAHPHAGRAGRAAGAVAGRRAAEAVTRWMVDASNVIGSKPDGWWRDRDGATQRLLDELRAFAGGGEDVTVVLDAGRPEWEGRDGHAGGGDRAAPRAATPPTTRSRAAWPPTPIRVRSASSPPTPRSPAARASTARRSRAREPSGVGWGSDADLLGARLARRLHRRRRRPVRVGGARRGGARVRQRPRARRRHDAARPPHVRGARPSGRRWTTPRRRCATSRRSGARPTRSSTRGRWRTSPARARGSSASSIPRRSGA